MLAIRFTFLRPRFQSRDPQNPEQVEWPPHPDRVFAALIGATYSSPAPETYTPVLQWLSEQAPPNIKAGEISKWRPYVEYVPNELDLSGETKTNPPYKNTPRRCNPVTLLDTNLVYIWPQASPQPEQIRLLQELASRVGYLASPHNQAMVSVDDAEEVPSLVPDPDGRFAFRVLHPHRLQGWNEQYKRRAAGDRGYINGDVKWCRYGWAPAPRIQLATPFQRQVMFRVWDGPSISKIKEVAQCIRSKLMGCAKDALGDIPESIHGHGERYVPHLAYSPRAFIRGSHANGNLVGVVVYWPMDASAEQRQKLKQVLAHPDLQEFTWENSRLSLQTSESSIQSTKDLPYTQQSREWATASPVMLNRFPKNAHDIRAILLKMLAQEGIPLDGADVRFSQSAFIPNIPPVKAFNCHTEHHKRPSFHMFLRLQKSIAGPLTLGTTRYAGLGHFIAL